MPPKDHNQTQLFFKTENGEYLPESAHSIEPEEICGASEKYITRYVTVEMRVNEKKKSKKILESLRPEYICNNWRKMHHLPLIRRRGKRK